MEKPSSLCLEFAKILDCSAQVFNGVCLVSRLRSNLHPLVLGRKAESAMFLPQIFSYEDIAEDGSALCLGETVILEEEINPFMEKLLACGIIVTAVHNHWLFDDPRLMYMHFQSLDDPLLFAEKVKEALDILTTEPVFATTNGDSVDDNYEIPGLCNEFNTILSGQDNTYEAGTCVVMKVRNNIKPTVMERTGQSFLLVTEMYTFESMTADGTALCSGEIVLLEEEVNPFISKLEAHGIIVTAVHNHWLFDNPRLMYMHFVLVDYPIDFAEKIKDALSVLITEEVFPG